MAITEKPVSEIKRLEKVRTFRKAGLVALVAGALLIASGVVSSSVFLTVLDYVNNYVGSNLPTGQLVVQIAIVMLTYLVGLGGIAVALGGVLLLLRHGSAGRILIGLGGGGAIFGLLFAMAEALYFSGLSAPVFHQAYFTLYWIGAILATASALLSKRDSATKGIV